jgi:methionyl-tRNA formyltransferase
MLRVLDALATGAAVETEQNHALATIAPKLSRQTADIDWTQSSHAVARRINGLSPWPGCRVRLMDGETEVAKITLVRARPVPSHTNGSGGTLSSDESVTTGDGHAIEILEVQPEGKRPMLLNDFRNGRPWRAGMRLESIT